MKKSISPAVAIALIVVVAIVAVFFFAKKAGTKKVQIIPGRGIVDAQGNVVKPPPPGRGGGPRRGRGGAGRAGTGGM